MSDKKDLYEDRYVLDDYDTPSFYGKSADKYFGDIDRDSKELRAGGYSRHNDLYEPTNYLKNRGMSRQEMEYYAGAAGIRNVNSKNDLKNIYKAYVDDKTGGRNAKAIAQLNEEIENKQPEAPTTTTPKTPREDSQHIKEAKERVKQFQKTGYKFGDQLFENVKTKGFYKEPTQSNVTYEQNTFFAQDADPDKQEYGQLIFS